ncbi:2-hydroxyacid dehydrogenase [Mucilaginibacter gotjawali]|uniref:D-lactate dehydrogenase n=2 Tax=Mucilaginibacter gotjawali TaxID=1550579 RepID=A0A839SKA2_9SPHI|nr:2-hydroxyacid dehydrogenase [Mucilaginibacter gotjawali]MBB3058771.1 D-lactate dehydrogenase [Mucilaginibacter gotjawali]BAU53850.1 D-lactate dehydrogenase [Mucilaginibacter gotjawali]
MKAVAYSIKPFEKEFLAKANQKKHDITLISNSLSLETAIYAEGKDAVIVFTNDDVSAPVIERLAGFGIKYITTRSSSVDQINVAAADKFGIKLANVPYYSPQAVAELTMALAFALNRHIVKAEEQSKHFDFRNDELIGFNFYGKTVGLVGLGKSGLAVANIFNGMGCVVIGYDPAFPENTNNIREVDLDTLFASADIISLHLPLTPGTKHIINKAALEKMKHGVMLINTSRGELINTKDVVVALDNGKIGYLGIDVYEYEKGLFFEDHKNDIDKDPILSRLMDHPNVLVTPHQAYLTREALQEIANQTIKNLDQWQNNTCVGNACTGIKKCQDHEVNQTQLKKAHVN